MEIKIVRPRVINGVSGHRVKLDLDYHDCLSIIRTIRARQDDCRKITEDMPNFEVMNSICTELECLKMKVVQQMPEIPTP